MKSTLVFLLLSVRIAAAHDGTAAEMLAKAARLGDLKTMESLLSSGVNPDAADRYGHAPLYYAASFSQAKAIELLLASHADPNPRFPIRGNGQAPATPLQYAAELGNRKIASLLIAAGARVNETGPTGRTALHYANNRLDVLKLLIDKGANVNVRDADGASPMDEAIWQGSLDTVAILLAHGVHLNESESKTGATPINEAAYKGFTQLVEYLLQFKPDLDVRDKQGYSPLDNAIRMGNENAALLLLDAEAKEKETPEFFERAMSAAIRRNESALVDGLLRHGASANGALASGSTPLDMAAFGGAKKVVEVLLKNNADPNLSGPNGNRPLEDAALKGYGDIAAMLLEHAAVIDHIGESSGTTALYSAASFGKDDVVRLLLERGANPNLCGKNGKSAYEAAVEGGYREVAAQILARGGKKVCIGPSGLHVK